MTSSDLHADRTREPTTALPPRSRQDGKAPERAKEHGAVLVVLGSDEGPDEGGPGGPIGPGEGLDLVG